MKEEMVVTESTGASSYLEYNIGGVSSSGVTIVSSGLSFMLPAAPSAKKRRTGQGRPSGSGWVQQLALVGFLDKQHGILLSNLLFRSSRGKTIREKADLGNWMVNSAGKAFIPHAIYVDEGEDVVTKIRSFVKKNRSLCILSACGSVSAVTLKLSSSSKGPVTYEGRFDIVCLSGSYLPAKTGGPRNGTGGVSISLSDPVGQVVGGAIGGKLIAATQVQVIAFSFTYDGKQKNKFEAPTKTEISSDMKSSLQVKADPSQGR